MTRGGAGRTHSRLFARVAAALATVMAPGILAAQTPVTAIGLGYPPPALDGRAAALGGTGIGLIGGSFSSRNPADLTMFGNPALGATLAPEGVNLKTPDGDQSSGRSRFVVLQGVLPVERWSFGFNISSELDQDWDVVLTDTLRTGFGDYPYVERRQQDGGLSSIGVSAAYQFGPLSVGAEGSALTGSLRQLFRRVFDPAVGDPGNQIGSASGDARWAYSGWRWRVGLSGAVGRRATLSASITSYSQLQARKDTFGVAIGTQYFDMPLAVAGGGSVLVTDRLLLAVGAGWNGWSGTDFRLYNTQAADVFWAGGGLEYVGLRMLNLPVPLRIGYRYTDLPFYDGDYEQLSETAVTFGFGTRLAGGRAVMDLGVEIGSRGQLETTGLEESFQRFSLTIGINAL